MLARSSGVPAMSCKCLVLGRETLGTVRGSGGGDQFEGPTGCRGGTTGLAAHDRLAALQRRIPGFSSVRLWARDLHLTADDVGSPGQRLLQEVGAAEAGVGQSEGVRRAAL